MTRMDGHGPDSPDGYSHPETDDPRYAATRPGAHGAAGATVPGRPSAWMVWAGAILAVVLVIGSVLFIVLGQGGEDKPAAQASVTPSATATEAVDSDPSAAATPAVSGQELLAAATAPKNANQFGGITVGDASNANVVRIFLDYNCSHCQKFEAANGADIQAMVADNSIQLDLHMMAFLKPDSTTAANAAATVADSDVSLLLPFSMALFEASQSAGFAGYTDQALVDVATSVGVPADVSARFADGTFTDWVTAANQLALESGITGTPSVVVGNQLVSDQNFETPNSLKPYLENFFAAANASATATP